MMGDGLSHIIRTRRRRAAGGWAGLEAADDGDPPLPEVNGAGASVRRLLGKGAIAAFLAATVLEGVYLVAANAYLRSGQALRALNRRPERFQIRWRTAWTLWPGTASLGDI